ncbi:Oxidoreductase BOA1 [Colletotrichum fructicola Nara gc5]|uniref:Nmra-like family protein n=1 Tax=Colletotrichum fructicola (strain Nara gc5) TaxID=1213859 RepID=L2GEA2_COLFN|nr:Oxidoreductase BOA1 [Colletotrichum fructicola]KAF4491957.1 Oxidoreductase BOA1 [Colletotrichum fructicola Nara gc5]
MAVIAVAGGTGNVGRTIVEAIVAAGKHEVKILARKMLTKAKANPDLEKEVGASIIVVDYANVEATTKALEDNNVHTVISAINMMPPPGQVPQEIELIRAADASKTTKRIVSSGWGIPHNESQTKELGSVPNKLKARAFLENETKDLEYAVVHNGFFLDYWAPQAEKSNMTPFTLFIDIPNDSAAIPGSGNVPSAFTHTRDVAKFVAAALDLKKWDNDLYIVGDKVTWNEFLKLAEDAKGTKFNVAYDSAEKLKAGQTTELPGQIPAYPFFPKEAYQALAGTFGWWFENGTFDIPPSGKKTLNELFPEIKAWKVKEILDKAWKKA